MEENKKRMPELRFPEFTDEWEERKLIEVCDYVDYRGKTPKKTDFGIFLVTAKNVKDGYIDYETSKEYISENDYEEVMQRGKPEIGDVLITTEAPCGNVAQVNKSNIALAQRIIKYRGHQNVIYNTYLKHYLLSSKFQAILNAKRSGGTVQGIKGSILHQQEIKYPKYDEQIKIGQYLDTLDNLITLHQRKLEHWKEVKKGLLQKMFPKKGSKVPEIRFPEFTDEWEERKLEDWGSFYYGYSCPKWSVTDDASTPCIRYGELYTKFGNKIDKVYSYTNIPIDKLKFSKGTEVLIPRVGEDPMDYNHCTWLSMPNIAIGEMISVFNTEQNPLFSATMFNATLQREFASRVEGGSVTNLYYEKLKNINVLYPSLAEQVKVATYFEKIDNLITLHQRKLEHLKELKKGLLQKMFV